MTSSVLASSAADTQPVADTRREAGNENPAGPLAAGSGPLSRAGLLASWGAVLVTPPERRVFPGHPEQAATARRFVGRMMGNCPATDTAVLLASELITNALLHTDTARDGTFDVVVWRGLAAVCVAVLDGGSRSVPAPRRPGRPPPTEAPGPAGADDLARAGCDPAESGYGLALVDRLATRWGYSAYDDGAVRGTAVWFLLRWNP